MKYIIYLHGFNSSPKSEKAQLTQQYFNGVCDATITVMVPALPSSPLDAISSIHSLIEDKGRENLLGFIGSSLGGFYSLYLQSYYALPSNIPITVLINPAVHPYDLLKDYVGENQNMYTGEKYTIKPEHMDDLKSLVAQPIANPASTFLLTQTDDEVLAFQEAVCHLEGSKMWIQYGGNHAFDNFDRVLPCIVNFFKAAFDSVS